MGALDWVYRLNFKKEDRKLLVRLLTFLETLRDDKEVVIRISLDNKKSRSPIGGSAVTPGLGYRPAK